MTKSEILDILFKAVENNNIEAGVITNLEWEEDGTYAGQMRFLQVPIADQPNKFYPYIIQTINYNDLIIVQIICLLYVSNSNTENVINVRKAQGWSVEGIEFDKPTNIIRKVRAIIKSSYGLKVN